MSVGRSSVTNFRMTQGRRGNDPQCHLHLCFCVYQSEGIDTQDLGT